MSVFLCVPGIGSLCHVIAPVTSALNWPEILLVSPLWPELVHRNHHLAVAILDFGDGVFGRFGPDDDGPGWLWFAVLMVVAEI
jgi:hypothetical protein